MKHTRIEIEFIVSLKLEVSQVCLIHNISFIRTPNYY